jgi:hypothetical protein
MSHNDSNKAIENLQSVIKENKSLREVKDELSGKIERLENSELGLLSKKTKRLGLELDKKNSELENLKEENKKGKVSFSLENYIQFLTENFTFVLFILVFSLAYSFFSNYQMMEKGLDVADAFKNIVLVKGGGETPSLKQRITSHNEKLSELKNKKILNKYKDQEGGFNTLHTFPLIGGWLTTSEERTFIDLLGTQKELRRLEELEACRDMVNKSNIHDKETGLARCAVNKSSLGEWKTFFQIIASILTIGAIVLFFLPRQKLKNARIGLEALDKFEFENFLVKFEEVHNQIKDTEELESEYSRSLALRSITNAVKTEPEMLEREERAKVVWVASNNLENDTKDTVLDNVLDKLKSSEEIEYIWIIPNNNKVEMKKRKLIKKIKYFEEVNGEKILGKCKIIQASQDTAWMLTHDIVVYDYAGDDTSVWESTFKNRYLELSNKDDSVREALNSIIKYGTSIFEINYEDQKTTS